MQIMLVVQRNLQNMLYQDYKLLQAAQFLIILTKSKIKNIHDYKKFILKKNFSL